MGQAYDTVNWALGEFVQHYIEDWMVVARYLGSGPEEEGAATASVLLKMPEALHRLAWESDKWRRKSEEDSVRISEWAEFSRMARETFRTCGIEARPWLN